MARSTTHSFTAERRILVPDRGSAEFLDKKFELCGRIYNNGVRYYNEVLRAMYADAWFRHSLDMWKASAKGSAARKEWSAEISMCMSAYGITEYDIHAYLGAGKRQSFPDGIGINIVQKQGTSLYKAILKSMFRMKTVRFRRYGQTSSFEDKRADSGIIVNLRDGTVRILGRRFSLKSVRYQDTWMQQALLSKVKYCRVVRRPFRTGYHYFLQIVMEGTSPDKICPGTGIVGIDEGISTVAFVADGSAGFNVLADGVDGYERAVRKAAAVYQRRQRMANPECFEPDGTIRKGARMKNRTSGMKKALFILKDAYRKKSAFVRQAHGKLTNLIVTSGGAVVKEPMDFKAMQKRSGKPAERSDKESVIRTKAGAVKTVRKFKRKKRFGTSISRRSPGLFNSLLEQKALKYGMPVIDVDLKEYRASQFDHLTGVYTKHGLSDRTKTVGGHKVQRDLYSAFLLKHFLTTVIPDIEACKRDFSKFLALQEQVVAMIRSTGDITGNFGLKDFAA